MGLAGSPAVMPLAGGLAHPEFGTSVNPILTRGADYLYPHITACPPGFENLMASLTLGSLIIVTKAVTK
jgi:hypothetical protein